MLSGKWAGKNVRSFISNRPKHGARHEEGEGEPLVAIGKNDHHELVMRPDVEEVWFHG